jgi:hypothetical protein
LAGNEYEGIDMVYRKKINTLFIKGQQGYRGWEAALKGLGANADSPVQRCPTQLRVQQQLMLETEEGNPGMNFGAEVAGSAPTILNVHGVFTNN